MRKQKPRKFTSEQTLFLLFALWVLPKSRLIVLNTIRRRHQLILAAGLLWGFFFLLLSDSSFGAGIAPTKRPTVTVVKLKIRTKARYLLVIRAHRKQPMSVERLMML